MGDMGKNREDQEARQQGVRDVESFVVQLSAERWEGGDGGC